MNTQNIVWHTSALTREQRERLNGQRAKVIWLTGLSGAGKSTLAHALDDYLFRQGKRSFVLDGDNVRHGLCSDLDFSPAGRHENLRRIAEVSRLFVEAGTIVIAAFISPMRADRAMIRNIVGPENFLEIYVACPLSVCETRDVKGMYRRARAGEIKEFTGISAPYEPPESPDLVIDTSSLPVEECIAGMAKMVEVGTQPA